MGHKTAKWWPVKGPDGFPVTIAMLQEPEKEDVQGGVGDDPLFPSFVVALREYTIGDGGRKKPDFVRRDEENDRPNRWRKL